MMNGKDHSMEIALIENAAKEICRVLGGSWDTLPENPEDDEMAGRMALREAAKAAIQASGVLWADNVDPNSHVTQ
ncbi:hypothetical protein AB1P65_09630 [Roseibium alexandrii]